MSTTKPADIDLGIARCRIVLSVVAVLAVYVDPTPPSPSWLPLTGGPFEIHPYTLAVMGAHLAYSVTLWVAHGRGLAIPSRLATVGDVLFGAAIALVTEGPTSPYYVFFAFAVLSVGIRSGLRATVAVTAVGVGLYLALILGAPAQSEDVYVMRPVYLALTGYLVAYLGQQRLRLEQRVRELEANAQREAIARSLHDGYTQALAGVNLRLETSRELLRRGRGDEAFAELTDLQASVNREHDEVRAYVRSLVDLEATPAATVPSAHTHFAVGVDVTGSRQLVEHVLHILLEGTRNIGRHARARTAALTARTEDGRVLITIDDDGVGFPSEAAAPPWSIASRVAECDGRIHVGANGAQGAHLMIELPRQE
jgi:signal transduction histidine kinase